jgi:cAMP-specific phosphodiesterase 4/calcium/calmodulin-dependent 3',5'-cyclic nucleotide phosphodiesterase
MTKVVPDDNAPGNNSNQPVSKTPSTLSVIPKANLALPSERATSSALAERSSMVGRRGAGAGAGGLVLDDAQDQLELLQMATPWGRFKSQLGEMLESPFVELFIVFLVALYAFLVCLQLVLAAEVAANAALWDIIDLVLCTIFFVEISLKSIAFGKSYYIDPINMVDGVVVVVSMVLSVISMVANDPVLRKVLSLRGILRLMRLVVMFRRVSESSTTISRFRNRIGGVDLSSPVDMVLDTLTTMMSNPRLTRKVKSEVMYAKTMISSGKLYEVNLDHVQIDGRNVKEEASAWIEQKEAAKGIDVQAFDVKVEGMDNNIINLIKEYGSEVQEMLEIAQLERWDYDMLELDRLTKQNCLPLMSTRLLKSCGLWNDFISGEEQFSSFITQIRDGYLESSPYHNAVHGADVLQTCFWFCNTGGLCKAVSADAQDFFCLLFAAMIHDVGHPGLNNVWHVKTKHAIALRYNDKAVLENMHVSLTYSVIFGGDGEQANIFKNMAPDVFSNTRAKIIKLVLATDMTSHFTKLGKLKTRITTCANAAEKTCFPEPGKKEDRDLLMENVIHACDISNPARRTRIYLAWTDRVLKEFFYQGDNEKAANIPVSMFMDKETTNIAKMQIGFISFLVTPLYHALYVALPALAESAAWLALNKQFWESRVEAMEEQMQRGDLTLPDMDIDVTEEELKNAIKAEVAKLVAAQ